jgi:succinate dehydrogenase / fumarate reductase, cytochrome b subunit
MNWLQKAITSNIGRKLVMSLTGLFLVSFLFVHVGGNLLLFANDQGLSFNLYARFMSTFPVIKVLEYVLLAGFLIHIGQSYLLTRINAQARPVKYAYVKPSPGVSWFSRNMGLSGSLVLFFLVIHIWQFYVAYHFGHPQLRSYPGVDEPLKDLYQLAKEVFQVQWGWVFLYVAACVLLAFHLNHGFQSAFRTLGVSHPKYIPTIVFVGQVISFLIPALFALMPLYFLGDLAFHYIKA